MVLEAIGGYENATGYEMFSQRYKGLTGHKLKRIVRIEYKDASGSQKKPVQLNILNI